ncbi:nose resistant to fluoxetine protein 6-like isoform X2 [Parasteatoda tepidariorum]|uniref:nose resistant to fluoxetine protein 6-like isoform X2 n=1 Tax=Parasteatoda tepidariorum TaxID=114398 RepID=UPI0039BC5B67
MHLTLKGTAFAHCWLSKQPNGKMKAIIIPIKLILVVLLLHQANGLGNQTFKHVTIPQYAKMVPGITQDNIILAWMNAEATLNRAYFNLFKSLLTNRFDLSLTTNISQNCTNSLFEYLNGLRNMKTWAFKMLDSSGKIPNGVMGGNPTAFGDFDTCLQIESPSQSFHGQYCRIDLNLPLPERPSMTSIEMPVEIIHNLFEPNTLMNNLAKFAQYFYIAHPSLNACLPSSCSKEDVAALFSNIMVYLKIDNKVNLPVHCEVKEDLAFTAMEIFIFILFSFLICLVVLGTSLDILIRNNQKNDFEKKEKSAGIKALLCFSLYTNFINLVKKDNNPDTLRVFHGLRVLSMTWIVWGHSYLVVNYRVYDGVFHGQNFRKDFFFQTVPFGFSAVENFFFMSSVLLSYICIRMRGKVDMKLLFLKRYLRLTPTMMLVVAFYAIVGRFGSGPLWKETVADFLSKNCLERGWRNLFYLNNIFYSSKTCLGWTWYLSTDTQVFIVSLFVCAIMRRRPGRGFLLAGLIIVISVLLAAFSHLYYKLPPTYHLSYLNLDDWFYYAVKGYTPIHFHLPTCAIGLIVGYILATKRGHIPEHINAIGWFLSFMTFLTMMTLTYKWNQGAHAHPGVFVSTLYGSTHRLAWGLCLAFITLSCTWGQGGIINSILSWEGFVPFSRLSYMVYLIHHGLTYIYTGSIRQSMLLGHRTMIFIFFNNMFLSFLAAFVLGLIFESPLMALNKAFLDGKLRKKNMPVDTENGTVILKNAE